MEYFKNLVVGLMTGLTAYLNPISGEIQSLIGVLVLNFAFGLLNDLLINHADFSFKKAWRCIVEATIFLLLICCIYFIGEKKGNPDGALQCVSFVSYTVLYFYSVNVIRNIRDLFPGGSLGKKVFSFLYEVVSVEFVKNIPYLSAYLQKQESKK